jgi:anti-sigma factor RsiW
MTCETFRQSLEALLDGDLDPTRREAFEAHLATCDACRALTADLQQIRQVAGTLERHAPPRDAWKRLSAQLAQESPFQQAAAAAATSKASSVSHWTWSALAAAASLAIIVGGGLFVLKTWTTPAPQQAGVGSGNAESRRLVESVESELQQAADHYKKAIEGLQAVANAPDSPLDPETTATLHANMAVIDKAIDESQAALSSQPESQVAQQSLFEAFRRKVSLLQDTIALMNELRKGNQAGAARIAEGLNKS